MVTSQNPTSAHAQLQTKPIQNGASARRLIKQKVIEALFFFFLLFPTSKVALAWETLTQTI